ncbi:MAG: DUF2905 domain-containing protein [Acidobacteria bacterium]|nr:DUF2905 domain-containing protein [Acidobacteriota bacterium]
MGRTLVILGLVIAAIGGLILISERIGLPLGRLPGDLVWRGKNTTFYFPLATSIVASAVLTLVMWLINRNAQR